MAVIHNTGKGGFLGGRSSKILTPSFRVFVTTAKKGLFSGLSTAKIHEPDGMPWAHIIYLSMLSKRERLDLHDQIVEFLNQQGERTNDPPDAILKNLRRFLEEQDVTREILLNQEPIMSRNEALRGMIKVIEEKGKEVED